MQVDLFIFIRSRTLCIFVFDFITNYVKLMFSMYKYIQNMPNAVCVYLLFLHEQLIWNQNVKSKSFISILYQTTVYTSLTKAPNRSYLLIYKVTTCSRSRTYLVTTSHKMLCYTMG